jgi:peptide/nickel transport system substrate-binding protein
MAYALDNEALTKSTLYGMGTPAHGPSRPGTKWYDPAVEQLHKFDLEKAKAELAQSSQPNGFTFDLLCENNPYIVQQATLVQAMLAKVNIKANVVPMEKVAYTTAIKLGDLNWFAGVSNWTSSVDTPDYMIKLVYTTKGSYQRSSYSNTELDKLVDDIEATSDEAKQKELMSQVQKIMAEDMPAVWFAWEDWLPAWRDYVKGYKPATTYYMYFDEVAIAPH